MKLTLQLDPTKIKKVIAAIENYTPIYLTNSETQNSQ